eukprot:RCo032442
MSQRFENEGWVFESTKQAHILPSAALDSWESELGVTSLPEMIFAGNTLTLSHQHGTGVVLSFNARDALRQAATQRKSGATGEFGQVQVACAAQWKACGRHPGESGGARVHDSGILWTFQTSYTGTLSCSRAG